MSIRRFIAAASLSFAFAALAASAPAAAATCNPIVAKATTTWYADTRVEVGEVAGLINGVIYLRYDDQAGPVDPTTTKPNLVIQTKDGNLHLWVYNESTSQARGSRSFTVLQMGGTGVYAGVTGKLAIDGRFSSRSGGDYAISGTLCLRSPTPVSR